MCLRVNKKTVIKTAKKRKTVYKIMTVELKRDKMLYSPFRRHKVTIGNSYDIENDLIIDSYNEVDKGFHSFKNRLRALWELYFNTGYYVTNYSNYCVVVKCEIPVGSQYVEGFFNNHKSYASNKIHYIKRISRYRKIKL